MAYRIAHSVYQSVHVRFSHFADGLRWSDKALLGPLSELDLSLPIFKWTGYLWFFGVHRDWIVWVWQTIQSQDVFSDPFSQKRFHSPKFMWSFQYYRCSVIHMFSVSHVFSFSLSQLFLLVCIVISYKRDSLSFRLNVSYTHHFQLLIICVS